MGILKRKKPIRLEHTRPNPYTVKIWAVLATDDHPSGLWVQIGEGTVAHSMNLLS